MNMWSKKIIYDITPFSLLDFPNKISCILWFVGCNMRCSYCYNPEIVFGKGSISLSEALEFVQTRTGLIEGAVMSGGECTLHQETIPLAIALKEKGMAIKIDTNGSHPLHIKKMLDLGLIDFISLDFKATHDKFQSITGSNYFERFKKSLQLLNASSVPYEIRTTYHSELLDMEDLQEMLTFAISEGYQGTYYIQNFVDKHATVGDIKSPHNRLIKSDLKNDNIEIRN